MTAILHALQKWLPTVKESQLILYRNNFAVATGVRKTSIHGNAMHGSRAIATLAALNEVKIESCWIITKRNAIADLLSRGRLQKSAGNYPNLQGVAML